ncbi:glycosyltransferase [Methanobrevibacter sp.]|uniref:glycosyltransferase n=1 Tax=Methanobrevibacter sp. TaxID=66852 RepID=UPI0026E0AA6E|nr:glycosyltransferase [Methanobrevibacter sp.]MDO5860021.1 glycosyltransferase family 1 protein [Methanobrevibacter sp.]
MKALFIVTGRGLGGDAMVALNTIKALEKRDVTCEIGLDASALGTLFEKNGYDWHKISVPHAGGHSATKLSAAKGGIKLLGATFKARSLINKLNVDFVVGVLGGGAIVGSLGAKFARKPGFSLISTPLDSKFCPKFNHCFILPELDKFRWDSLPENMEKSFYPLAPDIEGGDVQVAFSKLKEYPNFDENKKTILFSSGSSIFKGTIDAINLACDLSDRFNLVLVGLPLHDEYMDLIDEEKIIYLGYINWIKDMFKFADLAVLTDDGVSLEEALVYQTPIIALTKVKWGRYQNMAGVFKGAIIESEVEDVCQSIEEAFENYDSLKENALYYGKLCVQAADDLADRILKKVE